MSRVQLGWVLSVLTLLTSGLALAGSAAWVGAEGNEAPGAPPAFRSITAGDLHTCALLSDHTVKCWGFNASGQLGLGDTASRGDADGEMGGSLPVVDLGTDRTATALSANDGHTCALLDTGSVKCWGRNTSGELGLGDRGNRGDDAGEMGDDLLPVDLGADRTATAIAVGEVHTCAILDDGTVKCWGGNSKGQLGLGDSANRGDDAGEMGDALLPVDLGTGRTATAIAAGGEQTCALLDDATVKCWGANDSGQLGLGDTANRGDELGEMGYDLPAVALGTGRTATAISVGGHHVCARLDNAEIACWGSDLRGELGVGEHSTRGDNTGDSAGEMGDALLTVDLGAGRTAVGISASGNHATCALLDDATVRCWGYGVFGILGQGSSNNVNDPGSLAAVDLGTGRTATAIATGDSHACAALDNGTIKCWGNNNFGQLGVGDPWNRGDGASEMGDRLPFVDLAAPAAPSLSVVLTAEQGVVSPGDDIDYHVTIANTGNAALTDVTVSDAEAPDCEVPVPDLAIGAQHVVDCTYTTTDADVGTYANVATVDSAETAPVASNQVDVAIAITRQPDLAIRRDGGPTVGAGVHNHTVEDQTATAARNRRGRVVFFATVTNDGDGVDAFDIRRINHDAGLTVRYFKGHSNTDITAAVVHRTYVTRPLPVGSSAVIRVEIAVTSTARRDAVHEVRLRARSQAAPTSSDTVSAQVVVH